MKNYIVLFLSCLLSSAATVRAEEETDLGKHMSAMNGAFKAFRKETDPVKGAELAREAQVAAMKAALETPTLITEMPDGPDKVKAALDYRKMSATLVVTLCEVEQAFLDGKLEEVAKIIEGLKDLKKEGHKKFIKEDE